MPDPKLDVQAKLDEWLAANPEAQKYITKLYYVPERDAVPADATHVLRVSSLMSAERSLRIAAVVVPLYAAFLDMLLAMIATQPGTVELPGTPTPTTQPARR